MGALKVGVGTAWCKKRIMGGGAGAPPFCRRLLVLLLLALIALPMLPVLPMLSDITVDESGQLGFAQSTDFGGS